ncbi:2-isopropylmalate synthase [Bowmanella sp. Y26]|uniref:2-isopropylmalate synthase n=1 Tax=Bowmanella yangjiangensis TaxID=2811230 RepID=UPI001BDD00E4|nr:2-isopropylmalate synthase [Bowmanella yangjiangensis]MBT1063966.1 2-isopropylmalate synthase [Bowmanella yangjiangensis]
MLSDPSEKYRPYPPIVLDNRQWPSRQFEQAPRWCSTDLRDGNQALINPMDTDTKRKMFKKLVTMGFKEIEVAFPAASQTDFDFVRSLIEQQLIPDDVWIQVITQSRPDLIERTLASLQGAKQAVVHLYNATAPLFRDWVFGQDQDATIALAVGGARQIKALCQASPGTDWVLEYSPETFCFTEMEFALQICRAVYDCWQPCAKRPLILNLPATVEVNSPNVYADQIEWFIRHFPTCPYTTISVHPHNDRGTGVAAAELAVLAGAQRVEGCLFGNGERTGNVDLVTLAMNFYTQGIHPGLDFSNMQEVVELVEECIKLPVHPRHPYAGELVFTAFSGSHQDAIKKGFARNAGQPLWQIPYLPLDPADVGASYEAVIRVNSQSGKSGAAWLLQQNHGLQLPRNLQVHFSQQVQRHTEQSGAEMPQSALWNLFRSCYGLTTSPRLTLISYESFSIPNGQGVKAKVGSENQTLLLEGQANGLLSAMAQALNKAFKLQLEICDYHEHTLGHQSNSRAVAYLECLTSKGKIFGVGIDKDTSRAALQALLNVAGSCLAPEQQSLQAEVLTG